MWFTQKISTEVDTSQNWKSKIINIYFHNKIVQNDSKNTLEENRYLNTQNSIIVWINQYNTGTQNKSTTIANYF